MLKKKRKDLKGKSNRNRRGNVSNKKTNLDYVGFNKPKTNWQG